MTTVISFDYDRTLMETDPAVVRSYQEALPIFGIPAPDEATIKRDYIGPPLRDNIKAMIRKTPPADFVLSRYFLNGAKNTDYFKDPAFNLDDNPSWNNYITRVVNEFRKLQDPPNGYVIQSKPYEGIPEVLEEMKNCGLKLVVATSRPKHSADAMLKLCGMRHYFDAIYGDNLEGTAGRKEQVIYAARNSSYPQPETVIHVGDHVKDVEGAKKNGIKCIGACWDYSSEEALRKAGAYDIAHTPQHLLQIIKKLTGASLRISTNSL